MADQLKIELCPETGICSILRPDNTKVDLMPDEVTAVAAAAGKPEQVWAIFGELDQSFASKLNADELAQIAKQLV